MLTISSSSEMLTVKAPTQNRKRFGHVSECVTSCVDAVNVKRIALPRVEFTAKTIIDEEFALTEHLLNERTVNFLFKNVDNEKNHRDDFFKRQNSKFYLYHIKLGILISNNYMFFQRPLRSDSIKVKEI